MLRLKAAASKLSDFTSGTFQPVIGDSNITNAKRVIMCSGKIYWELLAERAKLSDTSTAIIRVEQLYPLPVTELVAEIGKYSNAELLWVQDEPANPGPWPFLSANLAEYLDGRALRRVSRRASASPATGSIYAHEEEQKALIAEAFSRS
jgi:2-oxoglutarate dehydrogenase E1 component